MDDKKEKRRNNIISGNQNPPSSSPPTSTYSHNANSFPPLFSNPSVAPLHPPQTIPTQINNNNNNNILQQHGWEVQLSVIQKFSDMYSKGDPFLYLDIMNQFLDANGINRVALPPHLLPNHPHTNSDTTTQSSLHMQNQQTST